MRPKGLIVGNIKSSLEILDLLGLFHSKSNSAFNIPLKLLHRKRLLLQRTEQGTLQLMKCVGVLNGGKVVVMLAERALNLTQKLSSIPDSVMWRWTNHPLKIDLFIYKIGIMIVSWLIVWIRLNWAFESTCPGTGTYGSLWRNLPASLLKQHPIFQGSEERESGRGVLSHSPTLVP